MMLQHFFTEGSRYFILGSASLNFKNRVPENNKEKRRMRDISSSDCTSSEFNEQSELTDR
jgi:hypothetical protein